METQSRDKEREAIKAAIRAASAINENSTKEEVLAAMNEHPFMGPILPRLSEELRGDREVVLKAMELNINQFKYASEELQHDKSFVEEVTKVLEQILQDDAKSVGQTYTKEELAKVIASRLKVSDLKSAIAETEKMASTGEKTKDTNDLSEPEI